MSIKYDPSKLLRKIAPEKKIKEMVSQKLTLKKTALTFISRIDFLSKESIVNVALKTIQGYRERVKDDPTVKKDLVEDPAQLIQRVQNEVILQVASGIKDTYHGESYKWLPSDADEPDPEHQLNYGEIFQIGVGEMPGDRFGCRCGMEILVNETQLAI